MKLNYDLVRDIALYVEEKADRPISHLERLNIPGHSEEDIAYHVCKMAEAQLINAIIERIPDDTDPDVDHVEYVVESLHWLGHEFIGAVQEPSNWELIKEKGKATGAVVVKELYNCAMEVARAKLREAFGLTP